MKFYPRVTEHSSPDVFEMYEGVEMSELKDFYSISRSDVKPGDVFAVTVTCHVTHDGRLKFYRCQYPPDLYDGIPQGNFYGTDLDNVRLQDLFPTIRDAVELPFEHN